MLTLAVDEVAVIVSDLLVGLPLPSHILITRLWLPADSGTVVSMLLLFTL